MKLFLSYASEDRPRAAEIAYALKSDGHEVFFDGGRLAGGEHYNRVIREELGDADLLVFLISPHSIESGSSTMTELRIAEERRRSPVGHVVPVLLEPTPIADSPAYLRTVTLFEPKGNTAAEIAAHIHRLSARRRPVVRGTAVAALIGATIVAVWIYGPVGGSGTGKPFVSSVAESDFVSSFVIPSHAVDRTEYSVDPTARVPDDRDDVVRLERLSFGKLSDGSWPLACGSA